MMAVAGIIETKAYFRKRGADDSEPPRAAKRQRVTTPPLEFPPPPTPIQQEPSPVRPLGIEPPAPALSPTPISSASPTILEAARAAMSVSWRGSADLRYNDDDIFEDSNDVGHKGAQFDPIISAAGSESSDMDSEDDGDFESNRSETEDVPDIFDTNVDLNTTEHSECS